LERRRRRGDLIETYKIIKNIDDIDASQFFETKNTKISEVIDTKYTRAT